MPLVVNNAHEPGRTCFTFSPDGKFLYSGGSDGIGRTWTLNSDGKDDEPEMALHSEEPLIALAASKSMWLSGSADSQVRQYSAGQTSMKGLFTRCAGVPVRSLAFDPSQKKVAVASDDLTIKVISIDDPENVMLLSGHTKGVRKVTWHPQGNLLTSSSSDGYIIVWDTTNGEEVAQIGGVIPAVADQESEDFEYDCSAVWHPTGAHFYAPTKSHDIASVSRETWRSDDNFVDPDSAGDITALAVSSNGLYIASATSTNQIIIYGTSRHNVLFKGSSEAIAINLAFSPAANLLAWTSLNGMLTRWTDVITDGLPDPNAKVNSARPTATGLGDGDLGMDIDFGDLDNEDWIIDDTEGAAYKDEPRVEKQKYAKELVSVTEAQPPFQPGATPMLGKRRYLAFNSLGVIEVSDQDIHHVVNVEFHDRTARKSYHFQDTFKYNMASLGERGILYACAAEEGHPAKIEYKPYATWASTSEWTYDLPEGETAVALAAGGSPPSRSLRNTSDEEIEGNGMAIVGTNNGFIRLFTGGGLERYIWHLGEDIISMVAGREWVFVVHREGGTSLDGCQNLKYSLIHLDTFHKIQEGRLPLLKGRTLKWISISDREAPLIYDSEGLLSVLDRFRQPGQARWVPLLDTRLLERKQGKDESYWPIGITNNQFLCVILKGREQHPGFPRPLIQELPVEIPLVSLRTIENNPEERVLRQALVTGAVRDSLGSALTSDELNGLEIEMDKELIKIIQLACKAGSLQRALDTAMLLHYPQSFDGASAIAKFYHFVGLEEKIQLVKEHVLQSRRREEDRAHRRTWAKHADPVAAPIRPTYESGVSTFAAPAAPARKPIALAKPIVAEPTSSSRAARLDDDWDFDLMNDESQIEPSSNKRKYVEEETQSSETAAEASNSRKRIQPSHTSQTSQSTEVPKPAGNPFAKRPPKNGASVSALGPARTLHKSDSFFDKIDAMDVEVNQKEKARPKGLPQKKDGAKQMTLLGFSQNRSEKGGGQESQATEVHEETQLNSWESPLPVEEVASA